SAWRRPCGSTSATPCSSRRGTGLPGGSGADPPLGTTRSIPDPSGAVNRCSGATSPSSFTTRESTARSRATPIHSRAPARRAASLDIVRQGLAREKPIEDHGDRYQRPNMRGTGYGKPLKSIVHPLRADLPIYLAAEGPKNVALAAEIADGWLPMFYAPRLDHVYCEALAKGFAEPGARHTP